MSDDRLLFPALKIDGEIMQRNWQILQAAALMENPAILKCIAQYMQQMADIG